MERAEKIQKLCLKMNVSEQEADAALRACGEDILDAALYLEALGRVRMPSGGAYSETPNMERGPQPQPQRHASESFGEALRRFGRWFIDLLKKGMENYLEVRKNGETSFKIPLTIFVIALFTPLLPLIVVLMIIGLFFDYGYHFSGPNLNENGAYNKAAAGCSNVARDIKVSFTEGARNCGNGGNGGCAGGQGGNGGFAGGNGGNGGFAGGNGGCAGGNSGFAGADGNSAGDGADAE